MPPPAVRLRSTHLPPTTRKAPPRNRNAVGAEHHNQKDGEDKTRMQQTAIAATAAICRKRYKRSLSFPAADFNSRLIACGSDRARAAKPTAIGPAKTPAFIIAVAMAAKPRSIAPNLPSALWHCPVAGWTSGAFGADPTRGTRIRSGAPPFSPATIFVCSIRKPQRRKFRSFCLRLAPIYFRSGLKPERIATVDTRKGDRGRYL